MLYTLIQKGDFMKKILTGAAWKALLVWLCISAVPGCKTPAVEEDPAGKIRDVYAGVAHVFVVKGDGTLWGSGFNRYDQLGLGEYRNAEGELTPWGFVQIPEEGSGEAIRGVKSIAAGESHSLLLKEDGSLWAAGFSPYGALGMEAEEPVKVFTRVKDAAGEPVEGVEAVFAGSANSFIIKSDGTLWAAGYNYYGQLGLGNQDNQPVFVRVESLGTGVKAAAPGARHTLVLKSDGTLWAAGANYRGQLAFGDNADRHSFTRLEDSRFSGVSAVLAGGDITLVRGNDGGLVMAGAYADPPPEDAEPLKGDSPPGAAVQNRDESAEGNSRDFSPVRFDPALFGEIQKAVPGYGAIYVISGDGHLWAAGSNRYGQLSLGYDTEELPAIRLVYP
jgi:alpha-tubulin suppressor-like RCC1 family protein